MAASLNIAPLDPSGHREVLQLFQRRPRQFLHLDWNSLHEWLQYPGLKCWVTRGEDGRIGAVLGATVPPVRAGQEGVERVAWLRLALPVRSIDSTSDLDVLWEALRQELRTSGVGLVGLLAVELWIERTISRWGFEQSHDVVSLRRVTDRSLPQTRRGGPMIRAVTQADMDAIEAVDAAAFPPLWRYDRFMLEAAGSQAVSFTLLGDQGEVLGYQISTQHRQGGHLARIAVLPSEQGRGLGEELAKEALNFFQARGVRLVTVNTQADNHRSLRLYRRLGFDLFGYDVPVWTLAL